MAQDGYVWSNNRVGKDPRMTRELEDAISAAVGSREPRTATEIAAELDVHPVTVRRHCQELQREGRLTQVTGGGYVRDESGPTEPRASD